MNKQRLALGIEYQGTDYYGWQTQAGLLTVQQTLENALSIVADHPVEIYGAGRTDKGVHATNQVVHFDTTATREIDNWIFGTNAHLPNSIRVVWAKIVPENFHARFSALERCYRYVLYNHRLRPALGHDLVSFYYRPLDIHLMQQAANYLLGEHDFTSFRGSECQAKHAVRTLTRFQIAQVGSYIVFEVAANGFLLHMVRNLVGALLPVGRGQQAPAWFQALLVQQDRTAAGMTMSPNGLYLVEVRYPPEFGLPKASKGPLFLPESLV